MVYYCCVKGCTNNSKRSKKDALCVSFHVFPSKPALRQKWLQAIGRPYWDPSSHVRICSVHFDHDNINLDGYRVRITDDAYPVKALPPNAYFEASDLEVCRFCLATEVKMYSLQEEALKMCVDAVAGFNDKCNIEGLPQYTCYECKANLQKCYSLIEKSRISQTTLLDIFAKNEQITKPLVRKRDRKHLNLISSLSSHYDTPSHIFEYTYNELENVSNLCRKYYSVNKQFLKEDKMPTVDNEIKIEQTSNESYLHNENISCKERTEATIENYNHNEDEEDNIDRDLSDRSSPMLKDLENPKETLINESNIKANVDEEIIKKTSKRKLNGKLTSSEFKMQEYYTIVKLSLQEQIEEFQKTILNRKLSSDTVFKCEVCCITFSSLNAYECHIMSHDPSRGPFECPVCKKRFKHQVEMTSHTQRMHGKKFICKFCPKLFHRVSVAKTHHLRHIGHRYQCPVCPFSSLHASALGVHARTQHATAHACARCGHSFLSQKGLKLHRAAAHRGAGDSDNETNETYRCQECGINFKSEGAKRVHILTSRIHINKNSTAVLPDPAAAMTCRWCGVTFPSAGEMRAHARLQHARTRRERTRTSHGYPRQCEHCPVSLSSGAQQWQHLRRAHHGARKPARVAGLCHTCGKGFQNVTKLRMHELRHSSPTFACAQCSRMFHDKYALAKHSATHYPARHRCQVCQRAFKLKGNLARHARVHTGEAPYECSICHKKMKYSTSLSLHIRSVHRRLPPPPRKPRARKRPSTTLD